MTPRSVLRSVSLLSPPPVTTCSGRLARVCPTAALRLSRLGIVALLTACRVAYAFPGCGVWLWELLPLRPNDWQCPSDPLESP